MSAKPRITPLSACHLVFLVLIAAYLCTFHPAGRTAALTILAAGMAAELAPRVLRHYLIGEALLVISACISYWWLIPPGDVEAFHAGVGMGIAYWMLVPSRLGMLRWVMSPVIVELCIVGMREGPGLAALAALPIGLAALAVDGWLMGAVPARSGARLRRHAGASLLRWALLPALIAATVGLGLGSYVVTEAIGAQRHLPSRPGRATDPKAEIAGLAPLRIGEQKTVDRDPRIAARLSWSEGQDPAGMVYLRAVALSELVVEDNVVSWRMPSVPTLRNAPPASRTPTRWAWVFRLPGGGDLVLRPDGGDAVDLDGLFSDHDGNLYRSRLGDVPCIYRADFDDGQLAADPATAAAYRQLPHELDALPWSRIEQPHWKEVSPERAAELVCAALRDRCSYALEGLPEPAAGPGGVLRTFMFGAEGERRGHCQYFATSAVLLLRRAGHAARCVAGFASDEFGDHDVVFRGLHAHAWVEVINSKGRWQRFDPTPPTSLSLRSEGFDPSQDATHAKLPEAQPLTPVEGERESVPAAIARHWPRALAAALLAVLAIAWWLLRRRGPAPDPRLAELQRHSDNLFRLATALGVNVGPATTLSQVAEAVQRRTGVDLAHHLDAHLRARFSDGPMPEPWPIGELRTAALRRGGSRPTVSS
jgi:transglutaminase-like putative cysteine protease